MISSQQLLLPLIGVWLKVTGLDNSGISKEHTLEHCLGRFVYSSRSFLGRALLSGFNRISSFSL